MYRFVVIEEKVEGQIFGSTWVKQVKMIEFCWQLSQTVHQVNTIQIQNSLLCVACFSDMVMKHSSRRSQAVLLRNGNEAIFRLESFIAQTCKTNKQKISIYHLGRLEIFMHELRKHLVYYKFPVQKF